MSLPAYWRTVNLAKRLPVRSSIGLAIGTHLGSLLGTVEAQGNAEFFLRVRGNVVCALAGCSPDLIAAVRTFRSSFYFRDALSNPQRIVDIPECLYLLNADHNRLAH